MRPGVPASRLGWSGAREVWVSTLRVVIIARPSPRPSRPFWHQQLDGFDYPFLPHRLGNPSYLLVPLLLLVSAQEPSKATATYDGRSRQLRR